MGKKKHELTLEETKDLKELLGLDDKELVFFFRWLEHGLNATKAYQSINPKVSAQSARVLGSRMLARVNTPVVLDALGIGAEKYFGVYREALDAKMYESEPYQAKNKKGETVTRYKKVERPNWDVRAKFHERLGRLLGFELAPGVAVQFNNQNQQNIENLPDAAIDSLLSR